MMVGKLDEGGEGTTLLSPSFCVDFCDLFFRRGFFVAVFESSCVMESALQICKQFTVGPLRGSCSARGNHHTRVLVNDVVPSHFHLHPLANLTTMLFTVK